jgi:hypothetical protein
MPNKEEVEGKTYKEVDEINKRVFYCLRSAPGEEQPKPMTPELKAKIMEFEVHHTSVLLSLIVEHLSKKGLLDGKTLDEMLIETVYS